MILENLSNCVIIEDNKQIVLYSYTSKIATINGDKLNLYKVYAPQCWGLDYSRTTKKHLRYFINNYLTKYSHLSFNELVKMANIIE